ncbi:WD40/YVTN/BNR-like repeat-containing protein [Microbacterium sp. CJ88]|uniref:WD40/YVTN/BNR-like repeat-containing protein n=1 Tax=Microbacterium sp. CJ88 TaxID=3445672 RepID=UPI003F65FD91
MSIPRRAMTGVVALLILTLTACAAPEPPSTGADHATNPTDHVHAIVTDPGGDGFLIGTHQGIYTATGDGTLGSRVGAGFDAMGLTVVGTELIASGHPGPSTPTEWGSPNLGIIRSSDNAQTWDPVAFTGEKDFHALTAAPDGSIYALATDSIDLQRSVDGGTSWAPTGASLMASALTVDATGRLVATTPDGLRTSTDDGATFSPWPDAPLLYVLAASPDQQRLVGVDTKERIWVTTAGASGWVEAGTAHGAAQAATITNSGNLFIADDSGLTYLESQEVR